MLYVRELSGLIFTLHGGNRIISSTVTEFQKLQITLISAEYIMKHTHTHTYNVFSALARS